MKTSDHVESTAVDRVRLLPAEFKARIVALDPEHVTERDVAELLAGLPAPQILCINGGVLPLKLGMKSFAQFLIGMGYPESSLRNPWDGSYAYGYYDASERIAGTIAWYYERDGLRPMLVGHSQGGIAVVRVLHKLAGGSSAELAVWNPVIRKEEGRFEIRDPLTGQVRPVVGLQVSFASAALAGGLARALPNEWDMNEKLRWIPDSVEEFTGFQKGLDPLGGDFLGYGSANDYHATGSAHVRNVRLPSAGSHSSLPHTQPLLKSSEVKDWIARYHPESGGETALGPNPHWRGNRGRILWAAEVWYSIKKHWVLELQRLVAEFDRQ